MLKGLSYKKNDITIHQRDKIINIQSGKYINAVVVCNEN